MDKVDIISFLAASLFIGWLGDLTAVELVVGQALWIGALSIGKKLIDRWVEKHA